MSDALTAESPKDAGLRIIIVYKVTKAILWLLLATGLAVGLKFGLTDALRETIERLDRRLSHEWAIRTAEWILGAITTQHIFYSLLALSLDGVVTGVEAWALHHRKPWGEWLVVFTTGSLIPFEIWAIVSHARLHRIAILAINVAIVWYLARDIRRRRSAETHHDH